MNRFFLAAMLLGASGSACADIILSSPVARAETGAPMQLVLTITNDDAEPLDIEIPSPLHVRFETKTGVATLDLTPDPAGPLVIAPREFRKIQLKGIVPADAEGIATLSATGLESNYLALQIEPSRSGPAVAIGAAESTEARAQVARAPTEKGRLLTDKPPAISVSVYEPVYVIVGGDEGLNAKFQISFRYRLFDDKGKLAERLPWIDNLYLSFSQTSLWDLNELSKPFKDTSYRPRLLFGDYDLLRVLDGRLRLGFEAGAGHESNGKEGAESRSFNMFYVRPAFTFGDPDGLRAYLAPLIHNYIAADENRDIADYRGYVDWMMGVGSKGGLDFWATLRKGKRSDFGSVELNLSYPLSKLSGGDLTGWLVLQYFGGYGESLIDYNHKLDSQTRLGIAIAL
ncbi:MAG: phospholipase A [Steroidobacteraceae bacterium]